MSNVDIAGLDDMALVSVAVDLLVADPEHAERFAAALLGRAGPRTEWLAVRVGGAAELLVELRTAEGWMPADLVRVVRRRAGARAAAVVATILRRQAATIGPDGTVPEWPTESDGLPPGADADPATVPGLRDVLLVLAALRGLLSLPQEAGPPEGARTRSAPAP